MHIPPRTYIALLTAFAVSPTLAQIVGKTNDRLSVSPNGQLAYEIPVETVSGTGGMAPCLSVTASSSGGTGLFGGKCDLIGISRISRAPRNLYRDGKADVVRFNASDRFTLDGERLTLVGTTADYREYRTERNSFARILSYGNATNPSRFVVYTKSGIIREYESSMTLSGTSGNSLYWLETKASDTKGNYYTVGYGCDAAHNEFWPERIDYTGNQAAGLEPYASVRFAYETCPMTSQYVSGSNVSKTHIIKEISCMYGSQTVRRYTFSYNTKENVPYVTSVTESTPTEKKNPTILSWDNAPDVSLQPHATLNAYENTTGMAVTGDFNGDGKQDVLVRPNYSDRADYKIFLSDGKTYGAPLGGTFQSGGKGKYINAVMSGDFNGDGLDDIIVERGGSPFWQIDLYLSRIAFDGSCSLQFEKTIVPSVYLTHTLHVTDVNCDGAADLIVRGTLASDDYFMLISDTSESGVTPLVRQSESAKLPGGDTWESVSLLDIDGDGTSEVLNMHSNNMGTLYSIGDGGILTREKAFDFGTSYYCMGDFNGDGKTDVITMGTDKNPSVDWETNFSTGLKDESARSFVSEPSAALFNPKDKRILVADFNGDGYDDLYAVDIKTPKSGLATAFIYINDKTGKNFTPYKAQSTQGSDKLKFGIAEFSGDGKADLYTLPKGKASKVDISLFISGHSSTGQLAAITDGLGNRTGIKYSRLTDGTVYKKTSAPAYPLVFVCTPWTVVSEVARPDGIGGANTTSYQYWNLLLHRRGGGVLGFGKVITTDNCTGKTRIDDYEKMEGEPLLMPKEARTYLGYQILSDEIYTNAIDYQYKSGQSEVSYFCYPKTVVSRNYEYTTGIPLADKETSYEYDRLGNCTRTTVESCGRRTVTENEYDNDEARWILGRLVKSKVTRESGAENQSLTSAYKYDAASGLLTEESLEPDDAGGYRKRYTCDKYGNITRSVTVPNDYSYDSRSTETRYDSQGRFKLETENDFGFTEKSTVDPALGVETSSEDINGLTTRYTRNTFGELQRAEGPLSTTAVTTEWSRGNEHAPAHAVYLVRAAETGEPETLEFYDGLGRQLRKVVSGRDGRKIYADVEYDSKGQVSAKSEPYYRGDTPLWTRYEYDGACRLVKERKPDGGVSTVRYDGLTTWTTDAGGNTSSKTYDMDGNLVNSTDALGGSVSYEYDAAGKCVSVNGPRTSVKMEYDKFGNRTRLSDPDLGTVEYKYTPYGEVAERVDSKGAARYEYDQLGRLTIEERPDASYTYIYDVGWNGAPAVACTSDGMRKDYGYDSYGRVISETEKIDGSTFTTKTAYNSQNKVETVEYPSGLTVRNSYTPDGYLQSVSSADSKTVYWTAGSSDASGRMLTETFGNGVSTATSYDAMGRTTAIRTSDGLGWTYAYDHKGNLTSRQDKRHGLSETFTYDKLGRLTETADNIGHSQRIEYDAAGNVTYKSGVGSITYQDGTNMIKVVKGEGGWLPELDEVSYTSFNKVSSARRNFSESPLRYESLTIRYGADKEKKLERTGRFMGGCGQNFDHHYANWRDKYYVGGLYEEERTSEGSKSRCYIYAGGRLVAISEDDGRDEKTLYVHLDHLGSVAALSDEQGNIAEEMSYDAWGRRRAPETWEYYSYSSDSLSTQETGFTGHDHIDRFDMIDMQGRMYDPVLGRFFSADPVVQMPEYTQSLNRYAYCVNNPLSLTDPTGYSWVGDTFSAIVGIAVGLETGGLGAGVWGAAIGGALGGASSSLVSSLINGNNLWQTAKNTFTGGLWGGASGFVNYEIGSIRSTFLKIAAHSVSEGGMEALRGGHFAHGFLMGLASSSGGEAINSSYTLSAAERIAANAALGGIVSEIGGGKFASGAMTAAYVMMFNELKHRYVVRRHFEFKYLAQIPFNDSPGCCMTTDINLKVNFLETHNKGIISLIGLACCCSTLGSALIPYIEVDVSCDKNVSSYFFKQYRGGEILPKGYVSAGDLKVPKFNINYYKTVSVKLTPTWAYHDPGMGRWTSTYAGTFLLWPINYFNSKSYKIK